MSFEFLDIGLPFFDDIGKQVSKQPYFHSYLADWISADNRLPNFQINAGAVSGITHFVLINSKTLAETDYLAYFNANTIETLHYGEYYYTHLGLTDVVIPNGRYYFYAFGTGGRIWWSEEFVVCGNIEEEHCYLKISTDDYLLIGGTDRLKIC